MNQKMEALYQAMAGEFSTWTGQASHLLSILDSASGKEQLGLVEHFITHFGGVKPCSSTMVTDTVVSDGAFTAIAKQVAEAVKSFASRLGEQNPPSREAAEAVRKEFILREPGEERTVRFALLIHKNTELFPYAQFPPDLEAVMKNAGNLTEDQLWEDFPRAVSLVRRILNSKSSVSNIQCYAALLHLSRAMPLGRAVMLFVAMDQMWAKKSGMEVHVLGPFSMD